MAMRLYHDLQAASVEPWLDKECLLPGAALVCCDH